MEALAADVLPAAVLARSSKSQFAEVLWGPAARELAAAWDGEGIDPGLVDAGRLREAWSAELPDTQTITLLQSVWWTRAPAGAGAPRAAIASSAGG
jgi:asparagine synthase (glutamine-hydrolysing)